MNKILSLNGVAVNHLHLQGDSEPDPSTGRTNRPLPSLSCSFATRLIPNGFYRCSTIDSLTPLGGK